MSSKEYYEFTFEDNNKFEISKQEIIEISQNLYSRIIKNNASNIIKLPKYIKYEDFSEFIEIYRNYISRLRQFNQEHFFISISLIIQNFKINIAQLLQISEFFENNSFSKLLIKDSILAKNKEKTKLENINHSLNINNAITLLILSYNKLREINNANKSKNKNINIEDDLENIWLELFMKSLDITGVNLDYFFNTIYKNQDYSKNQLWSLDKKIIDEIYEKFSYNLISNKYIVAINEEKSFIENKNEKIDLNVLEEIVKFLMKKRNQKDFFYLLSNEYLRIMSEENINELYNLPNPTFILKININEVDNYYEEYTLNNLFSTNDDLKLILIVYYKKNEDTFNVSIKLSKNNNEKQSYFDIMTFLSLGIIEELNNKQINVKSLSNNKSMYEIYKITNFKKTKNNIRAYKGSEINDYFTFKLFLKPCYIYILLSNYLFYNLENLVKSENIAKLNRNILSIIISKKYINKKEESFLNNENNNFDFIVEFLINWLNDEINIVEDISDIIKNIKWENVSLFKIFEFFIKYSTNISSDDIEFIFSKALLKILNRFNNNIELLSKEILKALVLSSNKINYISLFSENKKIKKFNLFELLSQRRYNYSELNSNNREKKYKTTNNSLQISIDNKENLYNFKNKAISKNNSNYKNKNNNINHREIKTCNIRSPINFRRENSLNDTNTKNISHNSNNICYNNFYSNYNNNFNINIRLDNKFKKIKNPKTINERKSFDYKKIKQHKNKNEIISRNKKNKVNDINLSSISTIHNKEQNLSYIKTINLKKKLINLGNKNNINKSINIKNLKLLQNKIRERQKDRNENKIQRNIHLRTFIDEKNKTEIKDKSSYNNFDKDNPKNIKEINSNLGNKINKIRNFSKKNKFQLKEILKIVDKKKKKSNSKNK